MLFMVWKLGIVEMTVMIDKTSLWSALQGNLSGSKGVNEIHVDSAWGMALDIYPFHSLTVNGVGRMQIPIRSKVFIF